MTAITLQERLRVVALWSWGLMAFCLPFSTALTLIFSAFGVLFGLAGFDWTSFKKVIKHPISILCVALFAWLALSMLWSIAPRDEMIEGVSKYRKLLYIPLLGMLLISTRLNPWFLMNFFTAGCTLVCIGSLLSFTELLQYFAEPIDGNIANGWEFGGYTEKKWFYVGPPSRPTFGRAHIAQGAFLIFSIVHILGYLLHRVVNDRVGVRDRLSWLFAILIGLHLFVVLSLGALTGYVLMGASGLIWVIYLLLSRRGWTSFAVLAGAIVIAVLAVNFSASTQNRLAKGLVDISAYLTTGAQTSEGLRLRFWGAGIRYGLERPLSGLGVGSFAEAYARDFTEPANLRLTRAQPHSEYVLQFVQGGSIALILFLSLAILAVAQACRRGSQQNSAHKNLAQFGLSVGIMLVFLSGFFNSLVWDAGEGHFFVLLLGVFIAIDRPSAKSKRS